MTTGNNNFFYLIDKPEGFTSFDVLNVLKKKLGITKIGHTGTLDPFATGLLFVAVGRGTKFIQFLEKTQKSYKATINLGGFSDTYDKDGKINFLDENKLEFLKKEINLKKIEKIIEKDFLGKRTQIPPKFSAIKINGERAYNKARSGEDFEMPEKKVEFFDIKILSYDFPFLELELTVSAGTYIRSFAYDLGKKLGAGGFLEKLRRTKIDNLNINQAQKLDDFDSQKFLTPFDIFSKNDFIELEDEIIKRLEYGQRVKMDLNLEENKNFYVQKSQKVIMIIRYNKGIIHPIKKI